MRIEPAVVLWSAVLMLQAAANEVAAATLESLVMPGPVVEGHAEHEQDCGGCHDLFERSSQRTLCLDCHEAVRDDMAAGTGYHSLDPDAGEAACNRCHTEHKGRDADITGLRPDVFDHALTDFPLAGAHPSQTCAACHQGDARYAEAPRECNGCHEDDDAHDGLLDSACADCHEPDRWRPGRFDHDTTDFRLAGAHAQADCLGCHDDHRFESPGSQCLDCHRSDDVHAGRNGESCGDCHDATGWDANFDHDRETGFRLSGTHAELTCGNCHVDETTYEGLPTDCHGCHSAEDVHLGRNGTACDDCHDQSSWSATFDHLAETGFELVGAHGELSCTGCHAAGLDVPLPSDCVGCHDTDDPHDGTLDACEDCHGQSRWDADQRFHHDLADFALLGLHRTVACESCHETLKFAPLTQECTDCHGEEDVHEGAMGGECAVCHNPAGWGYWAFDHGEATGFDLGGAHQELACRDCHPAARPAARQSRACASCHRPDDVHDGGFGRNCERCHTTESFEELRGDI